MRLTEVETEFVGQADEFLIAALRECGARPLGDVQPLSCRRPIALLPTVVQTIAALTPSERSSIRDSYFDELGVAYVVVENAPPKVNGSHPIFALTDQLRAELPLEHPLAHPLEGHPDTIARFGPPDDTVKVYDLAIEEGGTRYREHGETSELFALHHDGLGSGGAVETVVLYADSPALALGYTFFLNVVRLSLDLAQVDREAFDALFLPDAIVITRPRGKGAIRVTTPVLFLNESNEAQSFFRMASGEYSVQWRADCEPLSRARSFIEAHAAPFANGTSFLHFGARGHACFVRNRSIGHGRTHFLDGTSTQRCLARKWYMHSSRDRIYKHVPGMFLHSRYRALCPALFADDLLSGEWNYDASQDENVRHR